MYPACNLSVRVLTGKRITAALNAPGSFTGKVNNNANIGKTTEEVVQMWNEAHPDDRIDLGSTPQMPSESRARHT